MFDQACKKFDEIHVQWTQLNGALFLDEESNSAEKRKNFINEQLKKIDDESTQNRLYQEFFEFGPLQYLFEQTEISEILVNSSQSIWYEKGGRLYKHTDAFFSQLSYENIIERICQASGHFMSINRPFVEASLFEFRLTLIDKSLSGTPLVSLRRHPKVSWNLDRLKQNGWCHDRQADLLVRLLKQKQNLIVIGETGSGKTSVTNALLSGLEPHERVVIIEDCPELKLPNDCSVKLLTREDPYQQNESVTQQDLLRRSLRLRPDRLVMGEIRGPEAKDFLMMLSTGHEGSFATLHAQNPHEALIRLEMLIQLGAPQWKLEAIRRLIAMSLHLIVVTGRTQDGSRKLEGIYKLTSLEESGFTIEPVEV